MTEIRATIKRGGYTGILLSPHRHEDGSYVASTSRYEEDYIRVDNLVELEVLVRAGYGARMSNSDTRNAPSFIVNKSLRFEDESSNAPSAEELLRSIIDEDDLDRDSKTKSRKEQSLLRACLLGGSISGTCVICQHTFPFDMLVAAHLKKRSKCSIDEKRDIRKVASLMCKAGCDDLYEKGYISVDEGLVVKTKKAPVTERLNALIADLVGKRVTNWSGSATYYRWHNSKFNRDA